ncbi:GFA family protein [Georhizobium sp. MAB10]|jgi:hypothetical protein|uniref:GFA family protein n=1 Tax=Georhizobium sp. MAB10 TaxID=3028319 RepID=UPI00385576C0
MRVDGACHCGAIAFTAEIDPDRVTICHCTDCQRLTGTAYRISVSTRRVDFALLRGQPQSYVKVAESGNRREQAFCSTCGTPLWSADADNEESPLGLRVGTFAQRTMLAPARQIWCGSALPWSQDLRALPKSPAE